MMYKVLITGSRFWSSEEQIQKIADELSELPGRFQCQPSEITIIHGAALGVDTIANLISIELGMRPQDYPVSSQEWKTFGKRAGRLRNQKMYDLENPFDLVLGFHDDIQNSKGTKHMIEIIESLSPETEIKLIK